jgi:acetylglutamate kinase
MSLVQLADHVQSHEMPVHIDVQFAERLKRTIVLVKYGGNAMVDEDAQKSVIADIVRLKDLGIHPVIVHGGGRAIRRLLDEVGVESHFVDGHRQTDAKTMRYVEMALTGNVNQDLVRLLNARGLRAVGVSGKDASLVTARKRIHRAPNEKLDQDLGFVGDVAEVKTDVIVTLIDSGYVPVVSPVAAGRDGFDYNINADMFAGHLAGARTIPLR